MILILAAAVFLTLGWEKKTGKKKDPERKFLNKF
jgi:hypothetical protein